MNTPTVLFVEDNDDDLELAKLAIAGLDTPVDLAFARNGVEALDFLLARGAHANRAKLPLPKVVILDLNLPLLDGREVLKAIRQDPRACNLPVVVMTTSAEPPDMASVLHLHVNSYVQKPMDFERFRHVMAQILRYWLDINKVSNA